MDPTPARLKRASVLPMTFLSGVHFLTIWHCKLRHNTLQDISIAGGTVALSFCRVPFFCMRGVLVVAFLSGVHYHFFSFGVSTPKARDGEASSRCWRT
jgi:hypothetical protein